MRLLRLRRHLKDELECQQYETLPVLAVSNNLLGTKVTHKVLIHYKK